MGRLTVRPMTPGMQVSVLDSALAPVPTSSDWWEQPLSAGVYRIEGRVGLSTTSRLVTVRPGQTQTEDVWVDFAAAAPTYGSPTTNETHAALASDLVRELGAAGGGGDAGVVLILRNLRAAGDDRLRSDDVTLLDEHFDEESAWQGPWRPDVHGRAVGRAARLASGPYVLRTLRDATGTVERIDQTIWLSPDWVTVVFVPNTPNGPDPRGLSVHMTRLGDEWRFDDTEARAAEAALAGLRDGASSIGPDTAQLLLYGKFHNPMLGIIGLHTLLVGGRSEQVSADYLRMVIGNLRSLVGDHPDVVALSTVLPDSEVIGLAWPPMLERSYSACLIPADQRDPHVIPDESMAERIAGRIRIPGPWLRWTAIESTAVPGGGDTTYRSGVPGGSDAFDGGVRDLEPAAPAAPDAPDVPDAARDLVNRAVREIAQFHDVSPAAAVAAIGVPELARRTGLPTSLVATYVRGIR